MAQQNRTTTTIDQGDGFLARYGALGQLAASNSNLGMVRLFMTLMFLAVELTPVVMKLLLRRGPYDDFSDTIEHIAFVREKQARSNLNDDVHADLAIHSLKNTERIRLEERMTADAYDYDTVRQVAPDELSRAQARVANASIQDWLRKQMSGFGPRPPRPPVKRP